MTADQAIWHGGETNVFVTAHVDDVILVCPRSMCSPLKKHLGATYKYKDLGPVRRYTGFVITRDRKNRRLYMDQTPYVYEILDEFAMSNCTPSATPMDAKETWDTREEDLLLETEGINLYQRAIGKLMYLMLGSRPDIAYAVTKLAQVAAAPTERHWKGVLRIMKYLRSHESVRLVLGSNKMPIPPSLNLPNPARLIGYFDASLMDCTKSRKSTGAYCFFLDGSCISWTSKKQGLVALSSTEAEFIAGTEAAKELMWIINFMEEVTSGENMNPYLLGDNQGALALARNNEFRARTKHIHARERFITHMVDTKQCLIEYVPTAEMIADALTKALYRETFMKHARAMELLFGPEYKKKCKKCASIFASRNALYVHLRQQEHYAEENNVDMATLCVIHRDIEWYFDLSSGEMPT